MAPIYHSDNYDQRPYFVMPYFPGGSLADVLPSRMLPGPNASHAQRKVETQIVKLALDIAETVEFALDSGVLHLDLNPSNLLLADQDLLYVCDFGIAKRIADAEGEATATGLGT